MLKSEHQLEVSKFLNFLKNKKEKTIKETISTVNDLKEDSLTESIYNKEDVEEIIQKIINEVSKTMENEIMNIVRLSGAYVHTALNEAEKSGIEIHVDLNFLETNNVLDGIKVLEKKTTKDFMDNKPKGFGAKLPTLQGGYNNDPALQSKIAELTTVIENLKARNQQLQADLIQTAKGKGNNTEFSLLSEEDYRKEIKTLEEKITQKNFEIEDLKADMGKKLSESVQFNNMKKMIQQKNDQLKLLRTKLSKYENIEDLKLE